MTSQDDEPVVVFDAPNESVAEIVKALLESERIPVTLQSRMLAMYDGIMTYGERCWGSLFVPARYAERSRELIRAYEAAPHVRMPREQRGDVRPELRPATKLSLAGCAMAGAVVTAAAGTVPMLLTYWTALALLGVAFVGMLLFVYNELETWYPPYLRQQAKVYAWSHVPAAIGLMLPAADATGLMELQPLVYQGLCGLSVVLFCWALVKTIRARAEAAERENE